MPRLMEMFCSVAIRRRITAADVSARQAQAKLYPRTPHLQALLAAVGPRNDILDKTQMLVTYFSYL